MGLGSDFQWKGDALVVALEDRSFVLDSGQRERTDAVSDGKAFSIDDGETLIVADHDGLQNVRPGEKLRRAGSRHQTAGHATRSQSSQRRVLHVHQNLGTPMRAGPCALSPGYPRTRSRQYLGTGKLFL